MDENQIASFIRADAAPPAGSDDVPGSATPGAGHNNPPSPISVEGLHATLAEGYADLAARRDTLVGNADKYLAIEDDEADAKATDYVALVSAAWKRADDQHKVEKQPYLDGGRVVDTFFNGLRGPLLAAKQKVQAASTAYKDKKHKAALAEQERVAKLAREEEERKKAEALAAEAKIKGTITLEKAIVAETVAALATEGRIVAEAQAQEIAAKPQEATRIHASYGVSSLSYVWDYRITDGKKIPREFLMLNPDAVKARIKAAPKGQAPEAIEGIEFYQKPKGNFR